MSSTSAHPAPPRLAKAVDRLTVPTPRILLAMAAVLLLADQVVLRIGPGELKQGPFDEIANFLTGALILAARPRLPLRPFAIGLLTASVAIDLDHIPGLLSSRQQARERSRPSR